MFRVLEDPTRIVGEWCDIVYRHNDEAELLLCASPFYNVSVTQEGDDQLGVRIPARLDILDDLRHALNAFFEQPKVEAEMVWIQEKGQ